MLLLGIYETEAELVGSRPALTLGLSAYLQVSWLWDGARFTLLFTLPATLLVQTGHCSMQYLLSC